MNSKYFKAIDRTTSCARIKEETFILNGKSNPRVGWNRVVDTWDWKCFFFFDFGELKGLPNVG